MCNRICNRAPVPELARHGSRTMTARRPTFGGGTDQQARQVDEDCIWLERLTGENR